MLIEKMNSPLSLNDFLGVARNSIDWKRCLNFVLAVFLMSAISILFKKNINHLQTFIMAVINGALLLAGIILAIRYVKTDNTVLISLIIAFICSLSSLLYLDFYYIGISLLNVFTHILGHFVTFIFLVFLLKKLHYLISVFLTYVLKGITLGVFRFIITGNDSYVSFDIILTVLIYSLATAVLLLIGSLILKLKYYSN